MMHATDDGCPCAVADILEIIVLTVPQQRRLNALRDQHHEVEVHIERGPCGSLEATVTGDSYPPKCHIYGRVTEDMSAAEDMLAQLERAVDAPP